jgi:nucleoside-diphosphate-sugar epimerase
LIAALSGSGKALIHSSGSSIVADLAMGEPSNRIFDETTPFEPLPEKASRTAIDRLVLRAPGVRSVVLCNTMIYGHALGPQAQSVQIPALVQQAKASGVVRYIGRGLNRWSNVHIADVAALYELALAKARGGTFIYVESGEEALGEIAKAIASVSARRNLGPPRKPLPLGDGTWPSSHSAPTVACAAKWQRNLAGRPRSNRSRNGSPATSSSTHDPRRNRAPSDAGALPRCYRGVADSC